MAHIARLNGFYFVADESGKQHPDNFGLYNSREAAQATLESLTDN